MKRKKEGDLVIMGQMDGNSSRRFNLFDGKFATGYRVKRLVIENRSPTDAPEATGKLLTQSKSFSHLWNWNDPEEVAWAGFGAPTTNSAEKFYIRPDNMVIEDLYLQIYSSLDGRIFNFMIELEKYEFDSWDGAMTMVRNQSQSGPA